MVNINNSELSAQDSKYNEWPKVVDDMNASWSWSEGSRCYEQLKVIVYMNDTRLWA